MCEARRSACRNKLGVAFRCHFRTTVRIAVLCVIGLFFSLTTRKRVPSAHFPSQPQAGSGCANAFRPSPNTLANQRLDYFRSTIRRTVVNEFLCQREMLEAL